MLQQELDEEGHDIQILGLNEVGYESGNDDVTDGRDLPWLQDTSEADVWTSWGAEWRDVIILDRYNRVYATYNLTEHDLADDENYAELKGLLMSAGEI